jgi:adenosylcobinamide-GDP ribazoletransferase
MKKFLIAVQFLTIIPIRKNLIDNKSDIAESSAYFVVVGLLQGLLLAGADYFSGMLFNQELSILIVLLVLVISNGGFHLDGLADTFDALAAKSAEGNKNADIEKRLSIMRQGTIGPIGVTAIVFTLALKYFSLKSISNLLPFIYYSSLIVLPMISKLAVVVGIYFGRPARKDGLGNIFVGEIHVKNLVINTVIISSIFTAFLVLAKHYAPANQYIFYGIVLFMTFLLGRFIVFCFDKKFGGLTGDTLGAISEITEIIFLLAVIIWSRLFI